MQAMHKILFLFLLWPQTIQGTPPHTFVPAGDPGDTTSPEYGGELKTSCGFGAHQDRAGEPLPSFQPLGTAVSCI